MRKVVLLLVALFLSPLTTSCDPENIADTQIDQQELSVTGDPDSEEAEEEIDPND